MTYIPYQFKFEVNKIHESGSGIINFKTLEDAVQYAKSHQHQISKTWLIFKVESVNMGSGEKGIPVKYLDTATGLEVDLLAV